MNRTWTITLRCFVYAVRRGAGTFIGATPELLVRRQGARASIGRSADPAVDDHLGERLLRSDKDREENAIVARRIARALSPHAVGLTAAREPVVVKVANIQHLAAPIRAQLVRPLGAVELAGLLHPTPAVGGQPWPVAQPLIPAREGFDRGWYAGPVGWTDASGDGEFCGRRRCRRGNPRSLPSSGGGPFPGTSAAAGTWAASRELLRRVGGWKGRWGPAPAGRAAEDAELLYRLLSTGELVRYAPQAGGASRVAAARAAAGDAVVLRVWDGSSPGAAAAPARPVCRNAAGRLCPHPAAGVLVSGLKHCDAFRLAEHVRALAGIVPGLRYGLRVPTRYVRLTAPGPASETPAPPSADAGSAPAAGPPPPPAAAS